MAGPLRILDCELCGRTVAKTGHVQKYCPSCSTIKDRERRTKWRKGNGVDYHADYARKRRPVDRDNVQSRGAEISVSQRRDIGWYAGSEPSLHTLIRVAVPFDYTMSKNAIWSYGRGGHVFIRQGVKNTRGTIGKAIRTAMASMELPFVEGKLWIDVLVQKPDHKGDAVNVLDLVCDAAKDAIEIDDRWFSVRRLDWEIIKTNPMIYIGIGQEIHEARRACSSCGRQLNIDNFIRDKRNCKECRSKKAFQEWQRST